MSKSVTFTDVPSLFASVLQADHHLLDHIPSPQLPSSMVREWIKIIRRLQIRAATEQTAAIHRLVA